MHSDRFNVSHPVLVGKIREQAILSQRHVINQRSGEGKAVAFVFDVIDGAGEPVDFLSPRGGQFAGHRIRGDVERRCMSAG